MQLNMPVCCNTFHCYIVSRVFPQWTGLSLESNQLKFKFKVNVDSLNTQYHQFRVILRAVCNFQCVLMPQLYEKTTHFSSVSSWGAFILIATFSG